MKKNLILDEYHGKRFMCGNYGTKYGLSNTI